MGDSGVERHSELFSIQLGEWGNDKELSILVGSKDLMGAQDRIQETEKFITNWPFRYP